MVFSSFLTAAALIVSTSSGPCEDLGELLRMAGTEFGAIRGEVDEDEFADTEGSDGKEVRGWTPPSPPIGSSWMPTDAPPRFGGPVHGQALSESSTVCAYAKPHSDPRLTPRLQRVR